MSEELELTPQEQHTNLLDEFYPSSAEVKEELTDVVEDSPGATEKAEVEEESQEEVVDAELSDDDAGEESDSENDVGDESLVYDIDGEEMTLKEIKEAKKGQMLNADYTKKTQEVAKEREELVAEKTAATELRTKLDGLVKSMADSVEATKEAIDWEYLRDNDPSEFLRQKDLLKVKEEAHANAKTEADKLKSDEQNALVARESTLVFETNPEWLDKNGKTTEKFKEDKNLINGYIAENFTSEESLKLTDHKVLNAIRDAAKFNALKDKTDAIKKEIKKAPKAIKPSVKKAAKPTASQTDADVFYGK